MRGTLPFLAVVTIGAMVLGGCATSDTSGRQSATGDSSVSSVGDGQYPMTVSFCGQQATVNEEPTRVIAAGRTGVANIVAAGDVDKMVARFGEHGALYSPEIEEAISPVEQVAVSGGADHGSISFEKVLGLQPDVIYGSAIGEGDLTLDNLAANGIVGILPPDSCSYLFPDSAGDFANLDSIPQHVRDVGTFLNTREAAETSATDMESTLTDARSRGAGLTELKVAGVYYWDASDDLYAYGGNSTIQGIFNTASLKNVVDPSYDAMLNGALSPETILKEDPDVLVVTTGEGGITFEDSMERLRRIPGMTETTAFKKNQIIELPSGSAYPTIEAVNATRTVVEQRSAF